MPRIKFDPFLGFLVISFALLRAIRIALNGDILPVVTPDSSTYRVASQGWLEFAPVFEAKRPFLITFTYALLPTDESRVLLQSVFFTICWSALIIGAFVIMRRRTAKVIASVAIWLLGLSTLASQWETLILSESLTVSLLAATLALLLFWLKYRNGPLLLGAITSLIFAALIRPQLFVVVVLVAIAWWFFGTLTKVSRRTYLSAGVLLVIGVFVTIGQQWLNDRNFSDDRLVSRTTWTFSNALLSESPFSERLVAALPPDAPQCLRPDSPLIDTAGQFVIDQYRADCPEGLRWVQDRFQAVYFDFLLSDPVSTTKELSQLLWSSSSTYVYGIDSNIGPPSELIKLVTFDEPRYLLVLLTITAVCVVISWQLIARGFRRNIVVFGCLFLFFGASWVVALLLQIADLHRTSVTSIIPMNVLLILSFTTVIDGLLTSEIKHRPSTAGAPR